jgi:hypothetical protein
VGLQYSPTLSYYRTKLKHTLPERCEGGDYSCSIGNASRKKQHRDKKVMRAAQDCWYRQAEPRLILDSHLFPGILLIDKKESIISTIITKRKISKTVTLKRKEYEDLKKAAEEMDTLKAILLYEEEKKGGIKSFKNVRDLIHDLAR